MEIVDERDRLTVEVGRLTKERDAAQARLAFSRENGHLRNIEAALSGARSRGDDLGRKLDAAAAEVARLTRENAAMREALGALVNNKSADWFSDTGISGLLGLKFAHCRDEDGPSFRARDILRGRAALAQLDAPPAEEAACEGCGSTKTLDEIRAEHPAALSCCPERKMLTATQWRDVAECRMSALSAARATIAEAVGVMRPFAAAWVEAMKAFDRPTVQAVIESVAKYYIDVTHIRAAYSFVETHSAPTNGGEE